MREFDDSDNAMIASALKAHLKKHKLTRKDFWETIPKGTLDKLLTGQFSPSKLDEFMDALKNMGFPFELPIVGSRAIAPEECGSYSRAQVDDLEGEYLCIRPRFDENTKIISAYKIILFWADNSLNFREERRPDAQYMQKGRIYIPRGSPFFNLLTVDEGDLRLITVSDPRKYQGYARGLVTTLANPKPGSYSPASTPIVLRRLASDENPDFGWVDASKSSYESYRELLNGVIGEHALILTSVEKMDRRRSGLAIAASRPAS